MDEVFAIDLLRELRTTDPETYGKLWKSTQIHVLKCWLEGDRIEELGHRGSQQQLLLVLNERFYLSEAELLKQIGVSSERLVEVQKHVDRLVRGNGDLACEGSKGMLKTFLTVSLFIASQLPPFPAVVVRGEDYTPELWDIVICLSSDATLDDVCRAWPQVERIRKALGMKPKKAYRNFERDARWYYLRLQEKTYREIGETWAREYSADFAADLENYRHKYGEESKEGYLKYIYPKTVEVALRSFQKKIDEAFPQPSTL